MASRSPAGTSSALVRKSSDTDLMPPPPIKRIKRPPKVLDEDSYTDALSEIIARDFFPGLLESKHQQEYLDALESRDTEWIEEASRKLTEVMNTPQHRRRNTSFATPNFRNASATPSIAATPGPPEPHQPPASAPPEKLDTTLSLDAFQAKYTSEDNASFNTLLDAQNEKRRNAYAFLWNNNRIPGFRTKAHQKRLEAAAAQPQQKTITAPDTRPAVPNTWKAQPRNSLMFTPEDSPPPAPASEKAKEPPPKTVVYANTRMPPAAPPAPERPVSPSSTFIAAAIAGQPRSDSGFRQAETPRVNGYSFVDSSPTPFKLAATPKRELLLNRMVDKVAKGKRETREQRVKTPLRGGRMTALGGGREVPSFASSPALTPAGQRLWGNLNGGATARRETGLREGVLKKGPGERGFRWVATPTTKK